MKIGAQYNYVTILFCWQPAVLVCLCVKAFENDIETRYVRDLVRKLRLIPETPPYETDTWPWPVQIFTFGQFKILCDGAPVVFPRKARKKPLDLLNALLSLGGRGVREEAITDIVWPEAENDAAHGSFGVNLKRLRDILGCPEALQFRNGRLTLDERLCRVDFRAFEHFIRVIKESREHEKSLYAAQKAVDIYAGHFLPGEMDGSRSMPLRERLRAKYLSAVRLLGAHFESFDKWQEAAEFYERCLERDNLSEELYRRLMNCYIRLDRKSEALLLYARCKKTLSLGLGTTPSDETEKLLQSIKKWTHGH